MIHSGTEKARFMIQPLILGGVQVVRGRGTPAAGPEATPVAISSPQSPIQASQGTITTPQRFIRETQRATLAQRGWLRAPPRAIPAAHGPGGVTLDGACGAQGGIVLPSYPLAGLHGSMARWHGAPAQSRRCVRETHVLLGG